MTKKSDGLQRHLHEALRDVTGGDGGVDAEELLRRRAADLAARRLEAEEREILGDVVVVRREGVLLGTPLSTTSEVRNVEVVALPGSGSVVNGVFHIRGNVFSLVDLAQFFGDAAPIRHGEETPVVVISGSPGDLGLRIDEIVGPRRIFVDEIDDGLQRRKLSFVEHITHDLVHILDIEALTTSQEVQITGVRR